MITLQEEKWGAFWPDSKALTAEHNAEVGEWNDSRMPFDIDDEMYAQIDAAGALQIVTARSESDLIGYCFFTMATSLASKGILVGSQGPYFVTPTYRGGALGTSLGGSVGVRLFKESIRLMKERGVKNIYPHYYDKGDPALGEFFERLGAKPLMHEYSLWIGA